MDDPHPSSLLTIYPPSGPVAITHGHSADRLAIRRLVDAAALSLADTCIPQQLAAGNVLVARAHPSTEATAVGTVVLSPPARTPDDIPQASGRHIVAIAVRRRRRGRGIGRALIEAAGQQHGLLTARFRRAVRSFWDAIGFQIVPIESDRFWGSRQFAST